MSILMKDVRALFPAFFCHLAATRRPPLLVRPVKRFLPAFLLLTAGLFLAAFLLPIEIEAVEDQLAGFPDEHVLGHRLRPWILGFLCLTPALAALLYILQDTLDRYVLREFLGALGISFSAVFAIWLIIDLTDKYSDFTESSEGLSMALRFYGGIFPMIFVELAPFSLLLALILALGRLSSHQELVSIIQTGRGVGRLILPLAAAGALVSLFCFGFNYHWAPWAHGYKESLLREARHGTASAADSVVYFENEARRLWFITSFPYLYNEGAPLQNVVVRSEAPEPENDSILRAESAFWERSSGDWIFRDVTEEFPNRTLADGSRMPEIRGPFPLLSRSQWPETPWRLIKPGLDAENLGIPGLYSWLLSNRDEPWVNRRRFLTQFHYRFAQPFICLAIVLLAAPLGIVFSRRSGTSGVAVSVGLCAGIMLLSTVSLALGESGYLSPFWAAWSTNLIAFLIALILIQRRLVGRPIYQTLRRFFPF